MMQLSFSGEITTQNKKKTKWAWFFLLPWLIFFAIFYAYPLVYGVVVSFTDFTLGSMEWIGLDNYREIFQDYAFWRSLLAMLFYAAIIIPLEVFVPLWIAYTIAEYKTKWSTLCKMMVYLPGVVSTVALIIAWKFLFSPSTGLVAQILSFFGVDPMFSLFDQATTSLPIMSILVVSCCLGGNVIVYSAALGNIPRSLYEAAELDGITRKQQLRYITMPLIHQNIIYVLITSTIATLQVYLIPQMMTGGGPNYTTSALLLLIYDKAFQGGKFGYASALGVILFVLTAIVAAIQFRMTRREVVEY